jgi:two-component system, response regulator RegA
VDGLRVPEATPLPRQAGVFLIVEDDPQLRAAILRTAVRLWDHVHAASDFETARTLAGLHRPDHVLLDVNIPGGSGTDLIPTLREQNPEVRIVLFTAHASIAGAVGAVRLGAHDYLSKPATVEQILAAFGRERSQPPPELPPAMTLARARWEHIHRVLSDCGGNISTAAKLLGIQRQSLQRMLKKFSPP